jgi:adenylate cyclase
VPVPVGKWEPDVAIALSSISRCFQGDIPNVLATASADGVPNVIFLSQVTMVDDDHVAVSNQFLRKTMQNLAENPVATLLVIDPGDGESYKLLARHVRSECDGGDFEEARLAIDSMAAMVGMQDVFSLKGLEVFRVLDVVQVPFSETES